MEILVAVNSAIRRRALGPVVGFLLLSLLAPAAAVLAQDDEESPLALSAVPSSGAARSGPIRVASTATGRAADIVIRVPEEEEEEAEAAPEGVTPLAIQIDKIGVDAEIERVKIVNGVMQNPTGPWVVSWYEDLSAPGEENNVVMAGHVDYWDTGPAVFAGVPTLVEGDVIRVFGENDEVFEYEVQTSRIFNVAEELTPEVIEAEVVGETDEETLTLITCGGEFNYETNEYLSRMVLRATKI